jgi:hypothetical protein
VVRREGGGRYGLEMEMEIESEVALKEGRVLSQYMLLTIEFSYSPLILLPWARASC